VVSNALALARPANHLISKVARAGPMIVQNFDAGLPMA